MRPDRRYLSIHRILLLALPVLAISLMGADGADLKDIQDQVKKLVEVDQPTSPALPAAFSKAAPESIEDLKVIQDQLKMVVEKVTPATVGVRIGASQGSGVIVSKDGYVLTAGHVSGTPGRDVTIILPDGKTVKGKTLGNNKGIDSGMIKISEEKEFPFVEMGNSAELQKGNWCVAIGHPGGFKTGRSPVVRLGRIVNATKSTVTTDCTLVGGDSGGPLFDMHGKVIGIHSRIGGSIASNMHVPVNTYRDEWEKLTKPAAVAAGGEPFLGVEFDPEAKSCKVVKLFPGGSAEKGGIKADDVITKFEGQKIENGEDLRAQVAKKKVGDEVSVEVLRGEETLTLKMKLGKRE